MEGSRTMAVDRMGGPPPMTEEQRLEALARAQKAREATTEARSRLARREVDPLDVLENADGAFARLRVRRFLTAIPGIGTLMADRIMESCGIARNRRVAGLGCRQRQALAAELKTVSGR